MPKKNGDFAGVPFFFAFFQSQTFHQGLIVRIYPYSFFIYITIFTFCITNVESREPIKEMYFVGAGGEPAGEGTIFDNNIKIFGKFSNKSDWKTTVSLNGGHKKTEELISTQFVKANNLGPFVQTNYEKIIKGVLAKIESGELSAGDQLMITIDTHGAKNKGEKTHEIALSGRSLTNLTTLQGADTINLDSLERLVEIASKKGVKLAIVDLSCYSGNLLNIKNNNICMISSSSPDFPSYSSRIGFFGKVASTFHDKFYETLKSGRNLEDVFLMSMKSAVSKSNDFPMISTPEGQAVHELIYDRLRPFLYSDENVFDRQFGNMYSDKANLDNVICSLDKNFEELKSLFEQAAKIRNIPDQLDDFKNLNKYLNQYREYQKTYEEALFMGKEIDAEFKKIVASDYPLDERLQGQDGVLFLNSNNEEIVNNLYPKSERTNSPSEKEFIDQMEKNTAIQRKIISKLSSEQINALKKINDVATGSAESVELSDKIGFEVKKIFVKMYNDSRSKSSNPCRDFVL